MADNVTLPGTGSSIAADDISSVWYQRIKLIHGADGTNSGDVSGVNPFPVAPRYAAGTDLVRGVASSTSTSNTSVIGTAGAGTNLCITQVTVYNSSTTDTFCVLLDGTSTAAVVPAPGKGGAALTFPSPIRCADNTAFQFAAGAAVTTMYVSASGYKGS